MSKYKTIINNVNMYYDGEVIEVLDIGSIIEVDDIISTTDPYNRKLEKAILNDGSIVIASFDNMHSIKPIKVSKKGDKK